MEIARAWHIDTLDARGGLAFATWRAPIASMLDFDGDDKPCFFVGAPDFRAQPIANRAVALAAGRGVFQTGLLSGQTEVSFPTPDALVEFVRRTYVGSGAGDGTDGGGGEGSTTPRPSEGPDLPRPPGEFANVDGEALIQRLTESVKTFRLRAKSLKTGQAELHVWPRIDGHPAKFQDGPRVLCLGALYLITEVLRRFPSRRDAADFVRWQTMAHAVGRMLGRLDLWPLIVSDVCRGFREHLMHAFAKQRHLPALDAIYKEMPPDMAARLALWMLFLGGDLYGDRDLFYVYRGWLPPVVLPVHESERSMDLCRAPLPAEFDAYVPGDQRGRASVFHALAAFIGSPPDLPRSGLLETLILASAYVATTLAHETSISPWFWESHSASPVAEARVALHAKQGWDWLREQLPGYAFADKTEALIASSAGLRYTGRQPRGVLA